MGPEDAAWIVPSISMISLGVILFFFFYYRYKTRAAVQETIKTALDKGNELTPDLIDRMTGPKVGPERDLRRGMIAIAVGVGFAILGFMVDDGDDTVRPLIGVGAFPFLIGLAYMLMWFFSGRERKS